MPTTRFISRRTRRIILLAAGLSLAPLSGRSDSIPGTFRQVNCDGAGWFTNVIVHPAGRLYGRTDVGGIYRSDDHGDSWRFLSGNFTSMSGHYVQGLATPAGQADALYACLGTYDASGGPDGPERGIWKSADGGTTWNRIKGDLNFSGNDAPRWGGECIAIHPLDDNEVWVGSRSGGLWRSTDAGLSWTQQGASVFATLNVVSIALHASFPDHVWVGCEGGAWLSLDRGATWTQTRTMSKVWRITRKSDGTVFISGGNADPTADSDTRLWRVTAADWANPATYVYADVWPNWLAAYQAAEGWKPHEYNPGLTVLADGSLAAGSIYQRWCRSADNGGSWSLIPLAYTAPFPAWQYAPPLSKFTASNSLVQDPTEPARWFFAGGWGPARSTDAGATCRHIVGGIGEIVAWQVRFHPTDPQLVFLPVADMGMAVVSDAGDSGSASGFIYPNFKWPDDNIMFCHRPLASGNRIIAPGGEQATHKARLYVSQDQGATWSKLAGTGLPTANNREIVDAVASSDNPDDFIACTGGTGGVYRTTNGGSAFTKSTGLPSTFNAGDLFWWDIKLERDATDLTRRYAMLRNKGLYVSNDRGASWSKPTAQPPDNYGFIASDPTIGGRLWFYNHSGIFRSDDGGTNWSSAMGGFTSVIEADAHAGRLAVLGRRTGDAYDQVYYSGDDGATWRTVTREGYRIGNAQAVAVDPWRAGTVWISSNGRSVARFTPWTDLETWRNQYFATPENAGSAANESDPDQDNLANLIEYALGSNPVTASPGNLPAAFAADVAGTEYPAIRIHRASAKQDVSYIVEVSRNLVEWESGPAATATLTDTPALLEVRSLRPQQGEARQFFRLRITEGG